MKDWLEMILFWLLVGILFFHFYTTGVSESSGFKKIKVETKKTGNGFVVRIKPEGWELWKLEKKVETAKIFPPSSRLAERSEAEAKTGARN